VNYAESVKLITPWVDGAHRVFSGDLRNSNSMESELEIATYRG